MLIQLKFPIKYYHYRFLLGVLALGLIMLPMFVVAAQSDPTSIIDAAYRDLSTRLGKNIARGGDSTFSWGQNVYGDTSLGCPKPGMMYSQVVTKGYQIIINYAGTTYDYRATLDGSSLILCSPAIGAKPDVNATVAPVIQQTPIAAPLNFTLPGALAYVDANGNIQVRNPDANGGVTGVLLTNNSTRSNSNFPPFSQTSRQYRALRWSPDGTKLTFTDFDNNGTVIGYLSLQNKSVMQIAAGLTTEFPLAWSPDGTKLAYAVSTNQQSGTNGQVQQVQYVNVTDSGVSAPAYAGTFVEGVGCGGGGFMDVADLLYWAETGYTGYNKILEWTAQGFVHTTTCIGTGIALTAPDGKIVWSHDELLHGAMSPDRTKLIAFQKVTPSDPHSAYKMVMVNAASGAVTPVTTEASPDLAAWSPDGTSIVYSTLERQPDLQGAASPVGSQLFPDQWPLTTANYTARLWRMSVSGGASVKLAERTSARGFTSITVAPNNSGVAFTFIPSNEALFDAINLGKSAADAVAQAPRRSILYVNMDGSTAAQPYIFNPNASLPTFGRGSFTAIAAQAPANTNTDTTGSNQAPDGSVTPPTLTLNSRAVVTVGPSDTLNLRQSPSTGATVVRLLKDGTSVIIISGPTQSAGFRWWQIRVEDDNTMGWVVDQVKDKSGKISNTLSGQ